MWGNRQSLARPRSRCKGKSDRLQASRPCTSNVSRPASSPLKLSLVASGIAASSVTPCGSRAAGGGGWRPATDSGNGAAHWERRPSRPLAPHSTNSASASVAAIDWAASGALTLGITMPLSADLLERSDIPGGQLSCLSPGDRCTVRSSACPPAPARGTPANLPPNQARICDASPSHHARSPSWDWQSACLQGVIDLLCLQAECLCDLGQLGSRALHVVIASSAATGAPTHAKFLDFEREGLHTRPTGTWPPAAAALRRGATSTSRDVATRVASGIVGPAKRCKESRRPGFRCWASNCGCRQAVGHGKSHPTDESRPSRSTYLGLGTRLRDFAKACVQPRLQQLHGLPACPATPGTAGQL